MISIMPEYAPTTSDEYCRLMIAGQCTTKFLKHNATDHLTQASAEILYTISELFAPLVAPDDVLDHIDMQLLMENVVVTESDETTVDEHLTAVLHNLITHHINLLRNDQL